MAMKNRQILNILLREHRYLGVMNERLDFDDAFIVHLFLGLHFLEISPELFLVRHKSYMMKFSGKNN